MKYTLETERLILRPWKIEDAEDLYFGLATDCEVTKYLTWNPHKDIEETKRIISLWLDEYVNTNSIRFAIELKDSHELIGGIDAVIDEKGLPVVGYMLKRDKWNNGYMTEALKNFINQVFDLGYKECLIEAVVENIGSNRVIEKCGGIFVDCYSKNRPLKGDEVTVNSYKFIAR